MSLGLRNESLPLNPILRNFTPIAGLKLSQIRLHSISPAILRPTNRTTTSWPSQIRPLDPSILPHSQQMAEPPKHVRFKFADYIRLSHQVLNLGILADPPGVTVSSDGSQDLPKNPTFSHQKLVLFLLEPESIKESDSISGFGTDTGAGSSESDHFAELRLPMLNTPIETDMSFYGPSGSEAASKAALIGKPGRAGASRGRFWAVRQRATTVEYCPVSPRPLVRMGAEKHNGVANYCRRPVHRPFLQRIQYAIWNPEERTFLGRTPKRWVQRVNGSWRSRKNWELKDMVPDTNIMGEIKFARLGWLRHLEKMCDAYDADRWTHLYEFLYKEYYDPLRVMRPMRTIPTSVIGLIYLVMYICIIIFFSICMCGLLATMDERVPYFQLADSIIGDNPGMGHRPLLFEEGNLIWYHADNDTQIKRYVDNINEFLARPSNCTPLSTILGHSHPVTASYLAKIIAPPSLRART
ncbi:hypothetical protein MSG28_001940 [Choristoneura fumiferana]|uniref:Uncharacterized protein n=1 Tax=Choristoneura fumiferana TaxID=7141 RepID=A0ACC0JT92_CHOFU|nr:hypothetical protein MSG28_001940 [Choristoneura fumiferana]